MSRNAREKVLKLLEAATSREARTTQRALLHESKRLDSGYAIRMKMVTTWKWAN
jgi:hypothetical protein